MLIFLHDMDGFPQGLERVFEALLQNLNARLCPLEFVLELNIRDASYDPNKHEDLILPCATPEVFRFLADNKYDKLLHSIMSAIVLPDTSIDVFRSEIEDVWLDYLKEALASQRQEIRVLVDEEPGRFRISAGNLLGNVTLPMLSQLHTEFDQTVWQLQDTQQKFRNHGLEVSLFLNAQGSSAISQFVQVWVYQNMGIPVTGPQ